jgi:hypothetical protein
MLRIDREIETGRFMLYSDACEGMFYAASQTELLAMLPDHLIDGHQLHGGPDTQEGTQTQTR